MPISSDLLVAPRTSYLKAVGPVKVAHATDPVPTTTITRDLQVAPRDSNLKSVVPVQVALATEPVTTTINIHQADVSAEVNAPLRASPDLVRNIATLGPGSRVNLVNGSSKPLKRKGIAFTLDSGEACVKIPNSVIEKNKKSWECFVLGQFYSDPPSQGTIHNIVNGIWSKQFRDVAVSKMEGNAFFFRIPNVFT